MFFETKNKFDIKNPEKERPFTSDNFFLWSTNHMYRTSYNDMSAKKQVDKKAYAIPKYGGYVPTKIPNNELGKTYTKISRRCFLKDKIDNKPNFYATTGFNFKTLPREDETLGAWTHKYGK